MIELIVQHFRGLVSFSGREAQRPFWIWAGIVIGCAIVVMTAMMSTVLSSTFGRIEQFAAQNPDQVTRTVSPTNYTITVHGNHPELMPDFSVMLLGMAAISVVSILLLAAVVVRRLHDRDRTGAWGLPPAVLLLTGIYGMSQLFEQFADPAGLQMELFFAVFLNNLAYLASLGVLIVLLAGNGTPDDNRFGPPPA